MVELRTINVNCKTNPVSRASGGNAVSAAAYRAGEDIYFDAQRETQKSGWKRFASRSNNVHDSFILAPDDAPEWARDRRSLWNESEAIEPRKNSRTARDVMVGFAWELSFDQQRELVTAYAHKHFVSQGHVCDIAIHKYGSLVKDDDVISSERTDTPITGKEQIDGWRQKNVPFLEAHQAVNIDMPHVKIVRSKDDEIQGYKLYQPHAHILTTTRTVDASGWGGKDRAHDHAETALEWRLSWARTQNQFLKDWGHDVRVTTTKRPVLSDEEPIERDQLSTPAYYMERKGLDPKEPKHNASKDVLNDMLVNLKTQPEAPQFDEQSRLVRWWEGFLETFADYRAELVEQAQVYLGGIWGRTPETELEAEDGRGS